MEEESSRLEAVYGGYARSARRRSAWDRDHPGNRAIRAELRERLLAAAAPQLEGGGEVLDVGCGGGYWLRELAAAGVPPERLHGVELIPARVTAAAGSMPAADVRLADARKLPFEDRSFGLALMLTALSSMPDRTAARVALAEAVRVLEPGGLLLVYEPALPSPLNRSRLTVKPAQLAEWCAPGATTRSVERLTVAPPLARAAARLSERSYDLLARLRPLLTHRLTVLEAR